VEPLRLVAKRSVQSNVDSLLIEHALAECEPESRRCLDERDYSLVSRVAAIASESEGLPKIEVQSCKVPFELARQLRITWPGTNDVEMKMWPIEQLVDERCLGDIDKAAMIAFEEFASKCASTIT